MNQVNVLLELRKDVDRRKSIVAVYEIVKFANETELNNKNAQGIFESLKVTTGKNRRTSSQDDKISVLEDEEQKELGMDLTKRLICTKLFKF